MPSCKIALHVFKTRRVFTFGRFLMPFEPGDKGHDSHELSRFNDKNIFSSLVSVGVKKKCDETVFKCQRGIYLLYWFNRKKQYNNKLKNNTRDQQIIKMEWNNATRFKQPRRKIANVLKQMMH